MELPADVDAEPECLLRLDPTLSTSSTTPTHCALKCDPTSTQCPVGASCVAFGDASLCSYDEIASSAQAPATTTTTTTTTATATTTTTTSMAMMVSTSGTSVDNASPDPTDAETGVNTTSTQGSTAAVTVQSVTDETTQAASGPSFESTSAAESAGRSESVILNLTFSELDCGTDFKQLEQSIAAHLRDDYNLTVESTTVESTTFTCGSVVASVVLVDSFDVVQQRITSNSFDSEEQFEVQVTRHVNADYLQAIVVGTESSSTVAFVGTSSKRSGASVTGSTGTVGSGTEATRELGSASAAPDAVATGAAAVTSAATLLEADTAVETTTATATPTQTATDSGDDGLLKTAGASGAAAVVVFAAAALMLFVHREKRHRKRRRKVDEDVFKENAMHGIRMPDQESYYSAGPTRDGTTYQELPGAPELRTKYRKISAHSKDGSVYEGHLTKRAVGNSLFTKINWNNRWFRLFPDRLEYHDADANMRLAKPKGIIYFNEMEDCVPINDCPNPSLAKEAHLTKEGPESKLMDYLFVIKLRHRAAVGPEQAGASYISSSTEEKKTR